VLTAAFTISLMRQDAWGGPKPRLDVGAQQVPVAGGGRWAVNQATLGRAVQRLDGRDALEEAIQAATEGISR
jgi:hypothetical protein